MILSVAISAFVPTCAVGSEAARVTGIWTGAFQVKPRPWRIVLHVSADSSGRLRVTLDSIDTGQPNVAENAVLKGSHFAFQILSVEGVYTGTLSGDGNTIDGRWHQGGEDTPLVFTRTSANAVPTIIATPAPAPAMPRLTVDQLKTVLDRELAPVLERGLLSQRAGGGLVVGVLDRGQRRIFAYGMAKPVRSTK